MVSNSTNTLVVPSGAACFTGSLQAGDLPTSCPVTNDMLQFLNLTLSFDDYFHAYCLNPPQADGCPYGYCPNAEVAGPLSCPFPLRNFTDAFEGLFVRIAAYLTNFFVCKYSTWFSLYAQCIHIMSLMNIPLITSPPPIHTHSHPVIL
jgi:hypothetical protein